MSWASSRYYHGKRVSRAHYVLLLEAESRGLITAINQGRRTIAEQTRFWLNYLRTGYPLAARPWPGAPHIKWGRANHAIDANAPQPVHHLADFYRAHGIQTAFNVPGEAWHMDTLDAGQLKRAAQDFQWRDLPTIKPNMRGRKVRRLKKIMWAHGLRDFDRKGRVYGEAAVNAIKRMQKSHKLKQDGIVGPHTWKVLLNK